MTFTESRWLGNGWVSIEFDPVEANCFLPILFHLATTYHFAFPEVIDILDGYAAEFVLLDSKAILSIDNYTFSIAFEKSAVRDRVLADLLKLPALFFGA